MTIPSRKVSGIALDMRRELVDAASGVLAVLVAGVSRRSRGTGKRPPAIRLPSGVQPYSISWSHTSALVCGKYRQ